jgi:hypothetical protein
LKNVGAEITQHFEDIGVWLLGSDPRNPTYRSGDAMAQSDAAAKMFK